MAFYTHTLIPHHSLHYVLFLFQFPTDCNVSLIHNTCLCIVGYNVYSGASVDLFPFFAVLGLEKATYVLSESSTEYQLTLKVLSTNNTIIIRSARLRLTGVAGTARGKSVNG